MEDFLIQLETLQKSFKSRTSKPHHIFWAEAEESRLQESLSQCLKQNQSLQHEIDELLSASEQDSKVDSSHLKLEISILSQSIQKTSHEILGIDSEILEKDLIISELLAKLDLVNPPEASIIGLPSEWKYFEGKQIEYEIISPRFLNDSEDSLKDENEVTVFSPSNKGKRNACKSLDIQVGKFFDSDEFEKKRGKASRTQVKGKEEESKAVKNGDEGRRESGTRDAWDVENGKPKGFYEARGKFFEDEQRGQDFENFDGNSGLDEGEEFEQDKQFYLLSGREMSGDEEAVEVKHTQGVIIEYMEEVPLDQVEDLIEEEKVEYGESLQCAVPETVNENEKLELAPPQDFKWEEPEWTEDLDQQLTIDPKLSDTDFIPQVSSPPNLLSPEVEINPSDQETVTNHFNFNHRLTNFPEEIIEPQAASFTVEEIKSEETKLNSPPLPQSPKNNEDHSSASKSPSISANDLTQGNFSAIQDSLLATAEKHLEPSSDIKENHENKVDEVKVNENIEDSKDKVEIVQKKNRIEEKPPVKKFFKYEPKVIPKKLQLAKNQKDDFFSELL